MFGIIWRLRADDRRRPERLWRRRRPESRQEAAGARPEADDFLWAQEEFYHPPSSAALRSASQTFNKPQEHLHIILLIRSEATSSNVQTAPTPKYSVQYERRLQEKPGSDQHSLIRTDWSTKLFPCQSIDNKSWAKLFQSLCFTAAELSMC